MSTPPAGKRQAPSSCLLLPQCLPESFAWQWMLKQNWDQTSESYPLSNPLKFFPHKINYVIAFVETKKVGRMNCLRGNDQLAWMRSAGLQHTFAHLCVRRWFSFTHTWHSSRKYFLLSKARWIHEGSSVLLTSRSLAVFSVLLWGGPEYERCNRNPDFYFREHKGYVHKRPFAALHVRYLVNLKTEFECKLKCLFPLITAVQMLSWQFSHTSISQPPPE